MDCRKVAANASSNRSYDAFRACKEEKLELGLEKAISGS